MESFLVSWILLLLVVAPRVAVVLASWFAYDTRPLDRNIHTLPTDTPSVTRLAMVLHALDLFRNAVYHILYNIAIKTIWEEGTATYNAGNGFICQLNGGALGLFLNPHVDPDLADIVTAVRVFIANLVPGPDTDIRVTLAETLPPAPALPTQVDLVATPRAPRLRTLPELAEDVDLPGDWTSPYNPTVQVETDARRGQQDVHAQDNTRPRHGPNTDFDEEGLLHTSSSLSLLSGRTIDTLRTSNSICVSNAGCLSRKV